MKRLLPWLIAIVLVAALCRAFPPFHLRSLKAARVAEANAAFNPTNFVEKFWSGKLLPGTAQAADAGKVLAAIAESPQRAREQFGRTVGISSSYCYFLRGSGRVVSVNEDSIGLAVNSTDAAADISVPLGLVFGNAVRDGTGLLSASEFPNAQEFNAIAAGLNNIVETKVLPELQRIAVVGKRVQFAGCVEVADEETDLKPLKLVPVSVQAE
jgi:predicted lipoprotein